MADRDDGTDEDRKVTLPQAAYVIRYRWRMLGASRVEHAVEPAGRGYVPACSYTGNESVLEDDGSERCLACIKAISKP